MTDITTIGFKAETSGLTKAQTELDKTATAGGKVDTQVAKLEATIGKLGTELATANTRISTSTSQIGALEKELLDAAKRADTFESQVESLNKDLATSAKRIGTLEAELAKLNGTGSGGVKPTSTNLGDMGRKAGMLGMQFEQASGQVAAGVPILRAFGVQAADIGWTLGFPLAGAIAGITAAIAGPFIAALFTAKQSIDELSESIEEMIESYGLTENQFAVLERQQQGYIDASQETIDKTIEMRDRLQDRIDANNLDEVIAKRTELGWAVDDLLEKQQSQQDQIQEYNAAIDTETAKIQKAKDTIDLYRESIGKTGTDEATKKSESLTASLESQIIALESGEKAALEYSVAQSLGLDSTEEIPAAIQDQIDTIYKLKEAQEEQAQIEAEIAAQAVTESKERAEQEAATAKAAEDAAKEYESLISKVENFGGAWSSTGSEIVDAFGSAVDVMDDYISRMDTISSLQDQLNAQREIAVANGEDTLEIDAAIAKMNEESISAQLDGYAQMTSAAASFFDEDSSGREALTAASKVFTAVELAQSASRAGAYALEAIASAYAAPFPLNFAAGAAMIAVMAGLGIFSSSSGSSYTATVTGTGTVLGDSSAQSESISAADEMLDVQVDQLAELRDLSDAFEDLSDEISDLVVSIVSADFDASTSIGVSSSSAFGLSGSLIESAILGGVVGIADYFSGGFVSDILDSILGGIYETTKDLIDEGISFEAQELSDILTSGFEATYYGVIEETSSSLWGLIESSSTSYQYNEIESDILDSFSSIFSSLYDAIDASLSVFGTDTTDLLDGFSISAEMVSFADKTTEEIEEELEAMFSEQGDLMAEYAAPWLTELQQIGEGSLETLVRVAEQFATVTDAFDMLGMVVETETTEALIGITDNIVQLTGDIDDFSDLMSDFISEFKTDDEQFEILTNSLTEALETLGISMFDSRDQYTDLIESLDVTTEIGQELFAALLDLNPSLDEFFDIIEENAEDALGWADDVTALQIALLEAQGETEAALEMERAAILEALDDAYLEYLQQEIWDISDEMELVEEIKDARIEALEEEQSTLESVIDKYVTSIEDDAISVADALAAAQEGDFSLADAMSVSDLDESDYATFAEYALAQAQQDAMLAEIGILAQDQLSEVEEQITLLEEQNYTLNEINDTIEKTALTDTSTLVVQNESIVEATESVASISEDLKTMQESMAKNMAKMANDISQIKLAGVSVYTLSGDTVAVTGV